ncbi:MAG: RmuC family protein [Gammaproteobacteria bacterium]|jgi:DNA recombination protein RmuC|nr:RmuC family protein [Gammaproteobacteria bacterium]
MSFVIVLTWVLPILSLGFSLLIIYNQACQRRNFDKLTGQLDERSRNQELNLQEIKNQSQQLKEKLTHELQQYRQAFDKHQFESLKTLQASITLSMTEIRSQVTESLQTNTQNLSQRVEKLTEKTQQQLQEISGQVEKRLADGFEKTTATFTDIVKRLALIDEAQKKITELSSNVVSLQEVLSDKRSRGAFGEIQLNSLIGNMLPANHFALQHTLSNDKRVDCILFLPEPTGNICIDAKFPLENYRRATDYSQAEADRRMAESQFKQDIRKHIQDIANKYIIANETADGAIMFIPAEAVFAEIHSNYHELVEEAQRLRVWLVSPTTLMAVLTTARAVLKDAATRKQVHIIQEHLNKLGKDFERFQQRMDNLAKHIDQAQADVKDVHISAKKISARFDKIEQVDLIEAKLAVELLDA